MKYKQVLLGIVICIIAEIFIYQINHKYRLFRPLFSANHVVSVETRQGVGIFTNPLLECQGIEEDGYSSQLNISKVELNDLINKVSDSDDVSLMSVYVRDLNNGPWIGINEKEEFIGGSLLKVPILISYFKSLEADPDLFDKTLEFKEKAVNEVQYFPPGKQIEVGNKYTIRELIDRMIDYSDNEAALLLFKEIDVKDFNEVFGALGFGEPNTDVPFPVNTKTYAGFFRILFNASYLNRQNSEQALQVLSKAEFDGGLTKLLPKDIVVAHKFGTRSDDGINQLHDCGIVYYPEHPYLVCIMSKGGSFDKMSAAIAEVSRFIYDEVDSGLKNK